MLKYEPKIAAAPKERETILLEFLRDEEVQSQPNDFEKKKNRCRQILVGNCRLMDNKLEKPGNYEIVPPNVPEKQYFDCDNLKGTVPGGAEQLISFTFTPPKMDELLKGIGALKGIGQWVETTWELKLAGGFVEAGQPDAKSVSIVLKAYVEQI